MIDKEHFTPAHFQNSLLKFFNQSQSYLPGTEDTVIKKAVPPGRDSPLHSGVADPCDYPKCG